MLETISPPFLLLFGRYSGKSAGVASPPMAAPPAGGGDAPLSDLWDEWQQTAAAERAARAAASLSALITSRLVPPALPTEVWVLVMDRAESCRCAPGNGKSI